MFTAPSRTRRRKRTDVRVKELEREVRALSELLRGGMPEGLEKGGRKKKTRAQEAKMATVAEGVGVEERSPPLPYSHMDLGKAASVSVSVSVPAPGSSQTQTRTLDVVDRGILSMEKATELFTRYVEELVPHHPTVPFPQGTTPAFVRSRKPTLFLAVLAAAAGTSDIELNRVLNTEILQAYAERIVIKGEKSVELIQAMLITITWYYPPDNFDELKFYQYIHMAATMAIDIGLGKRMSSRARGDGSGFITTPGSDSSGVEDGAIDSESIESRRTLLACYLSCAR